MAYGKFVKSRIGRQTSILVNNNGMRQEEELDSQFQGVEKEYPNASSTLGIIMLFISLRTLQRVGDVFLSVVHEKRITLKLVENESRLSVQLPNT